jgi:hypothetical protein
VIVVVVVVEAVVVIVVALAVVNLDPLTVFFFSWRDSPLVGLGLLLIHEDSCGF